MNKINNQFTSIEQITDRYLGTGKGNSTVNASGLSFEEILKQKQDVSESLELKFSKHASMRLENRKINLSKKNRANGWRVEFKKKQVKREFGSHS